jgi:hypothetical protein
MVEAALRTTKPLANNKQIRGREGGACGKCPGSSRSGGSAKRPRTDLMELNDMIDWQSEQRSRDGGGEKWQKQ